MNARLKAFLIGRWSLRRCMLLPFVVYVALCLFALLFANRLLFQPPSPSYTGLPGLMTLRSAAGQPIAAVYLEAPGSRKTVLYSHGNAEDLGNVLEILHQFRGAGYSVLAYDYEGYGRSGGSPSESGCYRAIDAAYNWLTESQKVSPADLIVYGHSVGSGPSVDLATRRPVGGLVLEGAFTSAFRVLTRWPILPFDRFSNLAKISRAPCPVLIVHARPDRVIAFHHGEALFAAVHSRKAFLAIDHAGHNDLLYLAGPPVFAAMRRLFGSE